MMTRKQAGFTLLEMLLVVALVAILAAASTPVLQSFLNRNELDIATNVMADKVYRAGVLARGVSGDSAWGVYATSSQIVLFQGSSYAARNTSFDEVTTIASSITLGGSSEYVFSKMTGDPVSVGTTTFTSINNETRTVVVGERGVVNY